MKILHSHSKSLFQLIFFSRMTAIFAALASIMFAALILLPYGIQYGIQKWLLSQGASHVKIEDIDFNPFTGRLLVKNLESSADKKPLLNVAEISLTITWHTIYKGRIYFEDILIKNSLLNINNQSDNHLQIGARELSSSKRRGSDKIIGFGIQNLTILNSKINFTQASQHFNIHIAHASTEQLASWKPKQASPTDISATISDGTLKFTGQIMPFAEVPAISGQLKLAKMPMEIFTGILLPKTLLAKGTIHADTQLKLALRKSKRPTKLIFLDHTLDGDITLYDLSLENTGKPHRLWHSKEIILNKMHVMSEQVMKQAQSTVSQKIQPGNLEHIDIQSIAIHSANINLHRNNQGKWLNLQEMGNNSIAYESPQSSKLSLKIGQVMIDGNSVLNIHDQSVKPNFQSKMEINKAIASLIDNTNPDQPSELKLTGKIDGDTNFNMSGQLQPFLPQTNMNIKGKITNMDLPPFTSYTKQQMGFVLKSGHMDIELQARITNDIIKGSANIKLNNLQITPTDPEKIKPLTDQLPVSLETTLALLRDKNKSIQMKVPITGNIKDPNFDFSDNINKALGKAAKTTSIEYLKYTMGPFGTLITIGELAEKFMSNIKLEPIKFEAGRANLNSVSTEYLQQVAELLTKRPELHINICGIAMANENVLLPQINQDSEADDEELLLLAKKRASVIKEHLIKQYNVKSDRLFICNPKVLTNTDITPHAKLIL